MRGEQSDRLQTPSGSTCFWLDILKRQVEIHGRTAVVRQLGVSPSTLSLVLADKYPAGTDGVEARVMAIYGHAGQVACPALGEIDPAQCVTNWERAQKIGVKCGNPATIRLYKNCLKCDLRN